MTNLSGEGHDLYVNDGSGIFDSRAAALGLRAPTLPYTGFGAAWFDFDNDGWLDHSHGQWDGSTDRCPGARERSASASPAEAAVSQSR